MIVFDLACECGCQFEGWFQGHEDYEEQEGSGHLICPACGSLKIRKILSPVAVHTGASFYDHESLENSVHDPELVTSVLRNLQTYVEKNFDDVGTNLANKTLRMHYGIEEPRNIRGVATSEEEKVLEGEGIKLLKIPMPLKEDEKDKLN